MSVLPQQVKDFYILPVTPVQHANVSLQSQVRHILYIGPHTPKVPSAESARSLFIVNVPVDSTTAHFRALFAEQLGGVRVERVEFDSCPEIPTTNSNNERTKGEAGNRKRGKKRKRGVSEADLDGNLSDTWDRQLHKSGSTAIAVFVDRRSMEQALAAVKKATKTARAIEWGGETARRKLPALGSMRYKSHQALTYPGESHLQTLVDKFMTAYSAREDVINSARARQRSEPDAEGFITVTRGGRSGPARVEEAKEKLELLKAKEEKKRKEMEQGGFYRFQVREAKKRAAKELVGKFEKDKMKMEEVSKRRKRVIPE